MELKPEVQNMKQLAAAYKVHPSTLKRWLLRLNIIEIGRRRKIFTPAEVKEIYEKLGEP